MKPNGMARYEVAQHRAELEPIIKAIMAEHTKRKGCTWEDNAVDLILCDIAMVVEQYERCHQHAA